MAAAASTIPIQQSQVPTTASGFGGGDCSDVPAGFDSSDDVWHFVVPGDDPGFVTLSLQFSTGTENVSASSNPEDAQITGPHNKMAFVSSPAGAQLNNGSAMITGTSANGVFVISSTCAAGNASRSSTNSSPSPASGTQGTTTTSSPASGTQGTTSSSAGTAGGGVHAAATGSGVKAATTTAPGLPASGLSGHSDTLPLLVLGLIAMLVPAVFLVRRKLGARL